VLVEGHVEKLHNAEYATAASLHTDVNGTPYLLIYQEADESVDHAEDLVCITLSTLREMLAAAEVL